MQVIFYFPWDHWAHPGYFENRIPLKPALWDVCRLANYSVAFQEIQSNRVLDFRDFVCSLFPKAILFGFYFASFFSCKTVSRAVRWLFTQSRWTIYSCGVFSLLWLQIAIEFTCLLHHSVYALTCCIDLLFLPVVYIAVRFSFQGIYGDADSLRK